MSAQNNIVKKIKAFLGFGPKPQGKGTWWDSAGSLLLAVGVALTIRWGLVEAYVIPSGSMLPTLLIQDHIFVNKFIYGFRVPFSKEWILKFRIPSRGEVIVFKFPEDESTFFIKRVIGVPGDKLSWDGFQLTVNGEKVETVVNPEAPLLYSRVETVNTANGVEHYLPEQYDMIEENLNSVKHPVLIRKDAVHNVFQNIEVPANSLFVMGDNRDHSNDSRYWGFVPVDNILGRAMFVWWSCDETIPGTASTLALCNPLTTRWTRFFHSVR